MVLSVEYLSETSWVEVCKKVRDSVVFLDDISSECLHWHGGFHRLKKAGAVSVKKFSSFEGGKDQDRKAIFLIASPIVGSTHRILRDIISNSAFEHCIVITPCSPVVLDLATSGSVSEPSPELTALHKLESDILHWMKNKEFTVEIFHSINYGFIPLTDDFFLSPLFHEFFPCFSEDLGVQDGPQTKVADWDLDSFPLETQVSITYLMATLNSFLSQLNVREDIYCLGPCSNLIGSLIQKSPSSRLRFERATSTSSLLLIDRTLDVCSSVSFNSDSLLDMMKCALPSFPGQTIDVAINMAPILDSPKESQSSELMFPGCLHEPKGPMFDWLFYRSYPEILKGVSKEITSVLNEKEQLLSLSDLEEIIKKKMSCDLGMIKENAWLIQLSLGIIQTLKSTAFEKTKLIKSFQMLLLQILASDNNADGALNQIIDLIESRESKGFELEHIFYILVYFYSFVGEKYVINPNLETSLKTCLMSAVNKDKEKYCGMEKLNLDGINDVDEFGSFIFRKLNSLKSSRKHLFKYRNVITYHDSMMPLEYHSVLTQLIQDILDPMKIGIPDLRHKPSASSSKLTTPFSLLMGSKRTHITDNDSLLIIFIGGITGQEVKTIRQFFKQYQKPVIIGATSLLSPSDVVNKLFWGNQLLPKSL